MRPFEQPDIPSLEERHEYRAGNEAADMRPESNSTAVVGCRRGGAADELHHEPETENDRCRHADDANEEEYDEQHPDIRSGMKHQIRAKDAADRAAGADHGNFRSGRRERLHQSRRHAAQQVEDDEPSPSHAVLYVVPEDP